MDELARHDLCLPCHSRDCVGVVALTAYGAGAVSCMPVGGWIVEHSVVVVREVPTIHIVDEAVAVIIDAVIRHFTGISPDVVCKVVVTDIDARVDHRYQHRRSISAHAPGLRRADIASCNAFLPEYAGVEILPGVFHTP